MCEQSSVWPKRSVQPGVRHPPVTTTSVCEMPVVFGPLGPLRFSRGSS